jgi:hypothetical protein
MIKTLFHGMTLKHFVKKHAKIATKHFGRINCDMILI